MAVRPIDGNELLKWCEKIIDQACHPVTVQIGEVFRDKVRSMPTLTLSNEWVSVDEKLRADVVRFNDMLASYQNVLVPELRAELEQVKRERDSAVEQ